MPREIPDQDKPNIPNGYAPEERFGLLIARGGGISVKEWLQYPDDVKRKLYRLYRGLRMFPNRFLTSEVQKVIVKELGMSDHQRFLYMLFQGGYLLRDKDVGHRIVHVKTDLARSLTDEQLAADLLSKNSVMIGFPVNRKKIA